MKLLTPSANNDLKQIENARDILRTGEIRKAALNARKELANAQAEFNAMLAHNRHTWAVEEEAHALRLKKMGQEIDTLEDRKAKALIPISVYKGQADSLYAQAVMALKNARIRENDAEDLNERLQDKLDSLGQREKDLDYGTKVLENKAKGITEQSDLIITGNKKLTQEILTFGLTRTKAEKDIDERKTALVLWDRSLVAKEEMQKNTGQALEDLARQLKDERETLTRAWAELDKRRKTIPLTKPQ